MTRNWPEIKLIKGDITIFKGEAIVNAANDHLWMGAGVAGAIKRKGGIEIEKEAIPKGPIPVGEAVITSAGHLECKYVIHAAVMGRDLKTDAEKIKKATINSLHRAKELKLKTIAFPALGTGVGRFSLSECAQTMKSALEEYFNKPSTIKTIYFYLFSEEAYNQFQKIFLPQE
ncbi:MAG: macro domain-containing protein [Candidatus Aminicenantia bacterium]